MMIAATAAIVTVVRATTSRRPAGPPASTNPGPGPVTPDPPRPSGPEELNPQILAGFEYKERMEVPADVVKWNGRRIRVTGFINPTAQAKGLTQFFLVKDRSSCCFGTRPQINHYIDVTLKPGRKMNYTTDPVTIVGTLKIEDRWDGDWQVGLYWIEDGEVAQ
jgi:hypothetical protein